MANKRGSRNNTIRAEDSITVLFHGRIASKQIATNDSEGLTCEKVLEKCIIYIQDKVCVPEKQDQINGPKYLPTFGLVTCPEEKIWLPLNHVFKKSTEEPRIYKFRVRFRPPATKFNDNVMCEYLFIQMIDDFLKGPLGKNKLLESKKLFGLLQIALMIPSTLPLTSTQLVDNNFKSRNLKLWNFTNCFSKEIAQRFISQPIVDHFWVHRAIKREILEFKKHNPPIPLGYFKTEFYRILMQAVPNYCFEEYTATSIGNLGVEMVTVNLRLYSVSGKGPGLYYYEDYQCSLEAIHSMDLIKAKNINDKKWHVQINAEEQQPKILQFDEEGAAESFISMVQGYINLCVKYHFCLCKELQTASSRMREGLRSFGPLGHDTAERYLEDPKSVDPNTKVFLICESLSQFGHYDVFTHPAQLSQSQIGNNDAKKAMQSGVIECLSGSQLRLKIEGTEITGDCQEVRRYLKNEFGAQEEPIPKYSPKVDINDEFLEDEIEPYEIDTTSEVTQAKSFELPIIINKDLIKMGEIPGTDPLIKRYKVDYKTEIMMLVQLQSEKGEYARAQAFREGLVKLHQLNKLKPKNFLKFYSFVLDNQFSVLMEYAPLGDVLTYICKTPQSVVQKVNIMDQIVKILHITDEKNILHGNLRLRKFMAFDSQDPGFVTVKLGDPGISSYLDTLDLEHPSNIESSRLAWLSPERRLNLKNITTESEVYSIGTTLLEILLRNDQFHMELNLGKDQNMMTYLRDHEHLPCPDFLEESSEKPTSEELDGKALMPEAREVLKMVWDIILECWVKDHTERPRPENLLEKMREVKVKAGRIESDTVIDEMKLVAYDLGLTSADLKTTEKEDLTLNKLLEKFNAHRKNKGLLKDCIDVNYKNKSLGQGYYGAVWKGKIRPPQKNAREGDNKNQWTVVAIKRIRRISSDRKLLYKEVDVACGLDHPNIVKLLYLSEDMTVNNERFLDDKGNFVTYDPVMLIMEYMNKGSLSQYAQKYGPLISPSDISHMLRILLDVTKGMIYLSGKDIVHRDLAARNILLSEDEDGNLRAKVSDFGLARIMEDNYRFYKVQPTEAVPLSWMPPECFINEDSKGKDSIGKFSSQGDVWSFATLMWESFSQGSNPKNFPRKGPTAEELLRHYKSNWRLPKCKYMNDQVYGIMLKCWSMEPSNRPRFVELELILEDLLHSLTMNLLSAS